MKKIFTNKFAFLLIFLTFYANRINSQVTFSGLLPNYCVYSPTSALTTTAVGGYFFGNGVVGNIFSPALAGPGTHTISYGVCTGSYVITTSTGTGVIGGFSPVPSQTTEATVSLGDDQVSSVNNIGFSFNFYCNTYTQFYISSNGFITFSNNGANGCCNGLQIPTNSTPLNFIAAAWTDLNPGAGGSISYATLGSAPTRTLIVTYNQVPHFGGNGGPLTSQIKLMETTDIIEIHSTSFVSDQSHTHTQGIENLAGSTGTFVTGRNGITGWNLTNDMVRFSPIGNSQATQTTVVSPSSVTIVGNNSLCIGSTVNLSASGNTTYTWSTGSNNSNISVSPSSNTTYSVSATNAFGCVANSAITLTVYNGAPTLTSSASSNSVCLGTGVTLSVTGAPTHTWSGGLTSGVSFTPNATASYTVSGSNACGIGTSVQTITVTPLSIVTLASSTVVCAGHTSTLSAGGANTYTWIPGNISGPNVIISPLSSTLYTVTGQSGNCSGVTTISITVNPNPTVTSASSATSVCAGQTVTFTAYGANSYSWQTGATGSVITVSPSSPTAINVYGTNSFGCTSSTAQVVIVQPSPTLNITASNTMICLGGSVTLTANSSSNNYLWNTGSTNSVEIVSPATNTAYVVTSTLGICSSAATISIGVFTQTLSVSPSTAICVGSSITLNASGGTTYSWSDGSTGSSILVSPPTNTVYIVSANTQTNNMVCASSGTINITVNPNPTLTTVISKTVICKGETSIITASGATSYSWNTAATTSSVSVNPTSTTNYTVVGTDANGCSNSKTFSIKVLPCVGINELNGNSNYQLTIYPNPSNGEFTVKSEISIDLSLVDELGRVVRTFSLSDSNKHQVNVSDLANGIYFIVGKNDSAEVNQKIVVAK